MYSARPSGADGATINPAALTSPLPTTRGVKRARSPESPTETDTGAFDHPFAQFKRSRTMKSEGSPQGQPAIPGVATLPPPQTPTNQATPLPSQTTPAYSGGQPPKATPTKSTLKALPTVRDHTTDQLNPSGDEYIPREVDEFGEKKVMPNGQLLGGRQYRCRTFLVPNRGDKLFMLATECARNLSYRDSYLLFNKNRSLFKIIASQAEKDDLVQQEILPFSYRSRQIAIVTARSMFRQFGSRVIDGGRRVRDDYWETKARKQGFTENDLAGEKRPGAAKAREAAEAQNNLLLGNPNPEIVYNTAPGPFPGPPHSHLIPELSDIRPRDYSGIIKTGPRQEITGPAYQDQSRPSAIPELNSQAQHAAEYNRSVTQQRDMRGDYLQGVWRRTHEQPPLHLNPTDSTIPTSRATGSPHAAVSGMPQPPIVSSQSPQMMMTAAPYSQSINAQGTPMRAGSTAGIPGQPGYNYQSGQMWSQSPGGPGSAYGSYTTQSQQHASQSPAPQMRQGSGQMNPNMSQFPPMGGMQYGGQSMYPADQTPRQYMPQGSPTGQAWSGQHSPPPPQQQQQQQQQWWAQQQQQPQ